MKVGFVRQDITPMIPIDMAGYIDRKGQAKGVRDSLYGSAVLLEDNRGNKVAFIFLDILYITYEQTQIMKKKIRALVNIDMDHIIISATHTHSGPVTHENSLFGSVDKVYESWLLSIVPSLIYRASSSMRDCSIGYYQNRIDRLGSNRRAIDDTGDTYLTVLGFKDRENKVIGGIINFNCHPTVLSKENLFISADYPGSVIRNLGKIYGIESTFAFCNGAAGDISTRFTRRNQSHEEKERIGRILSAETIIALESMKYEINPTIQVIERRVQLKPRIIPDDDEIDNEIRKCKRELYDLEKNQSDSGDMKVLRVKEQGYQILKMLKIYGHILEYGGAITGVKIGKCCVIAQPAELFSGLGRHIIENSKAEATMIIGYANGIIGYLPDEASYKLGGYESLSCRFECGEGEVLANIAINIVKELGHGYIGGVKNN